MNFFRSSSIKTYAAGLVIIGLLVYTNLRWASDKPTTKRKTEVEDQWSDELSSRTEPQQTQQRPTYVHGQFSIVANDTVAKMLEEQVRVLCWIAVTTETKDRAFIIRQTWGRRCTKLVLIGDDETSDFPEMITLDVATGRRYLWPKTREAFRYIYKKHFEDADWFLKADTDTYVIMENLRHLLAQQDPSKPAYLGCNIQLYIKDGYNSGGAGYVLNKAALKLLVTEAYQQPRCHEGYVEEEDVAMGYCMSTVGVKPGDPTDPEGKNRFFPFEPADHVSPALPGANGWYWRSTFKPGEKNIDCCSDTWISFHYVGPQLLWNMEFLLYHSKIFGISTTTTATNGKPN